MQLTGVLSQALRMAEAHLLRATTERSLYRSQVASCKSAVQSHFTISGTFSPPPPSSALPSGSGPACVHYSFDFAQQVHYPHNPFQPGPMYFKTARKCGIFGVCCEGVPRQVNYLLNEAIDVGKGANTVISLLHHFLQHHGLGEVELCLHADNCTGQNKNNAMLQVCFQANPPTQHTHTQIYTHTRQHKHTLTHTHTPTQARFVCMCACTLLRVCMCDCVSCA